MNVKRMEKIISIMIIAIMLVATISTVVLAADTAVTPSAITGEGQSVTTENINNAGKKLVGILQAVGVVLSVVVLIIIGIKYMLGSAEEKAEYKKTLMPYIVGAALIFAASMFAQIAYDFFTGF